MSLHQDWFLQQDLKPCCKSQRLAACLLLSSGPGRTQQRALTPSQAVNDGILVASMAIAPHTSKLFIWQKGLCVGFFLERRARGKQIQPILTPPPHCT